MIKIPGNIPISIHPAFWFVALFIGWIGSSSVEGTVIWTTIILFSVLFHEFGHALTATAFGQTAKIDLIGFGGVTSRHGNKKLKAWQEFIIVLNGPLAGFFLSMIAWKIANILSISHPESAFTYAALVTFEINLFWTIINLAPVQPLDGGKLLTIFLEALFGIKGKKIALFISLLFAGAMGILFTLIHQYFAGALFFLFTFESYRAWKHSLSITEQDHNFILQHELKEAERDLASGHKEEALKRFLRLTEIAKSGRIYLNATEHAAHLLAEKGDVQEAHDLLISIQNKLSSEGIHLLHQLTYQKKNWQEAISLGSRAYQNHPDYNTAITNAICHAVIGEVRPAIGWLHCAVKEGIPDIHSVLTRQEFDSIRQDPLFLHFKASVY